MNYRPIYKIVTLILLTCCGGAHAQPIGEVAVRKALDLRNGMELGSVVAKVSSARVIYVGETHDKFADHLTQLEIIRRLHAMNPNIAIGMEQFQQPFQHVLDSFIDGELSEKELIRKSEWMQRWKFDYRLYRPILSYAREQHIPVIALNLPKEIIAQVSEKGIDGLSEDEKRKIPNDIDYSDQEYRQRLQDIYEEHAHKSKQGFEGFLQVQLLWDEGMAAKAAQYLRENPKRQLVVLAGAGHLMYGSGIPNRVSRRVPEPRAIILPAGDFPLEQGIADFLVQGGGEQLPEAGVLGVLLDDSADGIVVKDLVPEGAAGKAGVEKDDLIRSVNGRTVKDVVDLKLLLMDASPGVRVTLGVVRKGLLQDEEMELMIELNK